MEDVSLQLTRLGKKTIETTVGNRVKSSLLVLIICPCLVRSDQRSLGGLASDIPHLTINFVTSINMAVLNSEMLIVFFKLAEIVENTGKLLLGDTISLDTINCFMYRIYVFKRFRICANSEPFKVILIFFTDSVK